MSTKPLTIVISRAEALECAQALEYKAHMEAGQSQQPGLFDAKDTPWWALAKRLRAKIHESKTKRPGSVELDAARYRWLRSQHWSAGPLAVVANPREAVKLGRYCPSDDQLDALIDERMKP